MDTKWFKDSIFTRVEEHVRARMPWELGVFAWSGSSWGQSVMTSELRGTDSVPVRTNKHRDVVCPQAQVALGLVI